MLEKNNNTLCHTHVVAFKGGALRNFPCRDHTGASPWERQAVMGACEEGVDEPL